MEVISLPPFLQIHGTGHCVEGTLGHALLSAPDLVGEATGLPVERWIDVATGRSRATGRLAKVLPVMA